MGVRKKGRRQSDPSREEAESTDEENIQEVGFITVAKQLLQLWLVHTSVRQLDHYRNCVKITDDEKIWRSYSETWLGSLYDVS